MCRCGHLSPLRRLRTSTGMPQRSAPVKSRQRYTLSLTASAEHNVEEHLWLDHTPKQARARNISPQARATRPER
eukprot:6081689-Prymnesium_polylepis.1